MQLSTLFAEDQELDTLLLDVEQRQLIVYNDDVNTFDDVIQWFVEILDHEPVQAEQCAFIIHYSGKCSVKTGTWEELQPKAVALLDRGLSAKIH
jgi:ATP-dependent Clp protease adaptor protein ClpS